ncbi:MAG: peptidase M48 Ste24p, partial [Pseudomonas sp.]|nr:peptidase M48 Ste24p [Pseudomonas sp.]
MNFFEHQARAKRNSGRLILLLALAVISLITLTSLTLMLLLQLFGEVPAYSAESRIGLDWSLIGLIAAAVIAVVLLG